MTSTPRRDDYSFVLSDPALANVIMSPHEVIELEFLDAPLRAEPHIIGVATELFHQGKISEADLLLTRETGNLFVLAENGLPILYSS